MLLVPSISIHEGKVTRIAQGNFSEGMVYDVDPVALSRQFEDAGIKLIHFIDLDGAKKGSPVNDYVLEMISGHTAIDVNFAGGVHTDGDISKVLECGASSVTCATMAVYRPDLFTSWIMSYGREKIVLGADSQGGLIRVGGWQKQTKIDLYDHIEYFHQRGLKFLKTTDIDKEGVLEGPSFSLYERIKSKFPDISLFASGGIRNLDDIKQLHDVGVSGALFGKAFYEGRITLKEIEKASSFLGA